MNEWIDGWMDGWMNGLMDGWMDGWMDILITIYSIIHVMSKMRLPFCVFHILRHPFSFDRS